MSEQMIKKVLITGANGFIGGSLMRYYQNQGQDVVGVDLVGNGNHLVQLVGDEDDRGAPPRETANNLEELLGLLRSEHGRWLIKDEDVALAIERLQNLNALTNTNGERFNLRVWVDMQAVLL